MVQVSLALSTVGHTLIIQPLSDPQCGQLSTKGVSKTGQCLRNYSSGDIVDILVNTELLHTYQLWEFGLLKRRTPKHCTNDINDKDDLKIKDGFNKDDKISTIKSSENKNNLTKRRQSNWKII